MTKKFSKNTLTIMLIGCLVLVGGIGSILAYLTDAESTTNSFTIGSVKIETLEPDWPGNDSDDPKDLVPNEEVSKNPLVDNKGANDAIIFMTVDSPMAEITVVGDNGAVVTPKGLNELFWFKDAEDGVSAHANNFDSNWEELTTKEMYVLIAADGTETKVDDLSSVTVPEGSKLVKRYVFGYKEAIQGSASDGSAQTAENKKTTSLFDKVQLKNVIEGEVDGNATAVVIRTYAIQSSMILENGVDLTETLNAANLGKIYDIFVVQNSTNNDASGLQVEGMRDGDDVENDHTNRWDTTEDVSGEGANVKPGAAAPVEPTDPGTETGD